MSKNRVKVVIAGNTFELQGTESSEHITRVADFIHHKILELDTTRPEYVKGTYTEYVLTAINIADSYIKLEDELAHAEKEITNYEKTLGECIEENMALQERIDELGLEIQELRLKTKI